MFCRNLIHHDWGSMRNLAWPGHFYLSVREKLEVRRATVNLELPLAIMTRGTG